MPTAHDTGESDPRGPRLQLKFLKLPGLYAVVRLPSDAATPEWAMKPGFTSVTRTADELSVVCAVENVPKDIDPGPRWTCLQLAGPFPFSQTGVLLSFIEPLSDNGIPIFAVSTYDTDYVFVPLGHINRAVKLLSESGHRLMNR